jgi:hypothetical protein
LRPVADRKACRKYFEFFNGPGLNNEQQHGVCVMAISPLELRHIIECGFLPLQCRCSVDETGSVSIELVDPASGNNLVVSGIPVSQLNTSRAIASLVAELKHKIASGPEARARDTA